MLVSIAMATYNGSKYLQQQIISILDQTYDEFELIIVDDCSTDDTRSLLDQLAIKDSRIKLLHNDSNVGCSLSFEKALSYCSGDFIALCDQDDLWYPNKLTQLLEKIGNYDLVYSNCEIIDSEGVLQGCSYAQRNKLNGLDSNVINLHMYAVFNSFVLGCSMFFTRGLLEKALPLNVDKFNHDKWILFIASLNGGVLYTDQPLFQYRVHGGNFSISTRKWSISRSLFNFLTTHRETNCYSEKIITDALSRSFRATPEINALSCITAKLKDSNFVDRLKFLRQNYKYMFATNKITRRLSFFISFLR